VGLAYRAEIGTPPRKRAIEVSKDNDRLILEEDSLRKTYKLRSRAVYSLAGNRPDPAIEYLEEAVDTTCQRSPKIPPSRSPKNPPLFRCC